MEAFNMWESNIVLFVQENLRFEFMNPIWKFITSLGDEGIVPIALCILLIIFKKTRKVGITAGTSLALEAILINLTIKKIVGRTRPYVVNEAIEYITKRPSDNSFPSGHTGCILYVTKKSRYSSHGSCFFSGYFKTLCGCTLSNRYYWWIYYWYVYRFYCKIDSRKNWTENNEEKSR